MNFNIVELLADWWIWVWSFPTRFLDAAYEVAGHFIIAMYEQFGLLIATYFPGFYTGAYTDITTYFGYLVPFLDVALWLFPIKAVLGLWVPTFLGVMTLRLIRLVYGFIWAHG
jgi:hypothetical protein